MKIKKTEVHFIKKIFYDKNGLKTFTFMGWNVNNNV